MKSKIINESNASPSGEPEDNNENKVEIEAGGPGIAASKKNKIAIIAASSILVTLVLYFMLFSGDSSEKKPEKLEEVAAPAVVADVAPAAGGKSFFEIDKNTKSSEDLDLLKKPEAPQAPKLPELPADAIPAPSSPVIEALIVKPVEKAEEKQEKTQQNQNQGQNKNQNQNQNQSNNSNSNNSSGDEVKKNLDPRYSPIVVVKNPNEALGAAGSGGGSGTANSVGYNQNIIRLDVDGFDSLAKTPVTTKTTYIQDRLHTIAQGKLLNAVLETAINTELPGLVRAIVSRDVYGEAGSDILIPRGSRLFGSYSSKILRGQGRVEISWNRLIRPDGVDLTIAFNASDQFGRSGIPGETDNKYGSIIANSMLTSVLAVGAVSAAQKILGNNNNNIVTTNNPQQGTITSTGNATNQAISDVTRAVIDTMSQVVGNSLDLQPVIRVPQGTKITVIVNADINIPSMKQQPR
jgi:type IV secretion system protein VirB10